MKLVPPKTNRAISTWLAFCALMVLVVVLAGGYTRLTRSGLSIVRWDPIVGVVPPLDRAQWNEAFAQYQATPEYQKLTRGMSLDAFKQIYLVEWGHRLLGRLSGFVFFAPFVYWLVRRRLSRALVVRLSGLLILGGLQGAMGWYMVSSGLIDVPRVSPYRLTAHLLLATFLLTGFWWTALEQWRSDSTDAPAPVSVRRLASGVVGLAFVTIAAGALVAGTRAGFAFNTFPLMMGHIIPAGLYSGRPLHESLFEHMLPVQFHHRVLAMALAGAVLALWWRSRRADVPAPVSRAVHWLVAGVVVQVSLGIATLLWAVPIPLGVAHQAGAMMVLCLALLVRHRLSPQPERGRYSTSAETVSRIFISRAPSRRPRGASVAM